MSKEDELVLDDQNSSEQEQELELDEAETTEETVEEDNQGNDPLDNIQDVEELRREAKKHRSIAQRSKKVKGEVSKEETLPIVEDKSDFLTKKDYELANTKKGIRLATTVSDNDTDEVKALKEDTLANWSEIRQLYTPRRGKTTPEDILEDINDAYVLFNARRPKEEEVDDSAKTLTETKVKQATGSKPKPVTAKKEPKNFKIPAQPEEWY